MRSLLNNTIRYTLRLNSIILITSINVNMFRNQEKQG